MSTELAEIKKTQKDSEIIYREVPHNIQAEQALIGALLTNNDALTRVADFL